MRLLKYTIVVVEPSRWIFEKKEIEPCGSNAEVVKAHEDIQKRVLEQTTIDGADEPLELPSNTTIDRADELLKLPSDTAIKDTRKVVASSQALDPLDDLFRSSIQKDFDLEYGEYSWINSVFESIDVAKDVIGKWVKEEGFSIRKSHTSRNKMMRQFARSSKPTKHVDPSKWRDRVSERMDCQFMVGLRSVSSKMTGSWRVSRVKHRHNHEPDYRRSEFCRNSRALSSEQYEFVDSCLRTGLDLKSTTKLLEVDFPHKYFHYKTVKNAMAKAKRHHKSDGTNEAVALLIYLRGKKMENQLWYVMIERGEVTRRLTRTLFRVMRMTRQAGYHISLIPKRWFKENLQHHAELNIKSLPFVDFRHSLPRDMDDDEEEGDDNDNENVSSSDRPSGEYMTHVKEMSALVIAVPVSTEDEKERARKWRLANIQAAQESILLQAAEDPLIYKLVEERMIILGKQIDATKRGVVHMEEPEMLSQKDDLELKE
ncbi:hypothetical protein BGW38_005176 [Lunasporangiospora selenospora]|uniref:FAR1 domain-containing protein n=1 Tax=Lunasporangiospora selenospora TaxID=979761 RepID=A0A9P6FP32_9FUNG|nr:hypothetical protein BGW38_005176 [Lunasporangiospora selenospora]